MNSMSDWVIFRRRSYPVSWCLCSVVSASHWPSLQSLTPVILLLLWHTAGWNLYHPRLHIYSSCWLLRIHSLGWTLCDVPYCCLCRMKRSSFMNCFWISTAGGYDRSNSPATSLSLSTWVYTSVNSSKLNSTHDAEICSQHRKSFLHAVCL